MSFIATGWAKKTTGHRSPGQKFLLLVLAEYANPKTNLAWPSIKVLAEDCMTTDRSVVRALKALERAGFVTRLQRGNRYQTSVYRINVDGVPGDKSDIMSPLPWFNPPDEGEFQDCSGPSDHPVDDTEATDNTDEPPSIGDMTDTYNLAPPHSISDIRDSISDMGDFVSDIRVGTNHQIEPPNRTASSSILMKNSDGAAAATESAFVTRFKVAYEANVGRMPPHLADAIREFDSSRGPPESWGEEAVFEAVEHNAPKWSYIRAILHRWCEAGEGGGAGAKPRDRYDPGVEVEPGIFMRGDHLPYTDPGSPYYQQHNTGSN